MRLIDADAFMERLKYMKELNARHPLEKEQLDDKEVNNYEIGQKETFELAMEHLEIQPTAFDLKSAIEKLQAELNLADKEKERCIRENPLQFDSAKGYANGIADCLEIIESAANATNGKNGG